LTPSPTRIRSYWPVFSIALTSVIGHAAVSEPSDPRSTTTHASSAVMASASRTVSLSLAEPTERTVFFAQYFSLVLTASSSAFLSMSPKRTGQSSSTGSSVALDSDLLKVNDLLHACDDVQLCLSSEVASRFAWQDRQIQMTLSLSRIDTELQSLPSGSANLVPPQRRQGRRLHTPSSRPGWD